MMLPPLAMLAGGALAAMMLASQRVTAAPDTGWRWLLRSATAEREGITNEPTPEHRANLVWLAPGAQQCLAIVREIFPDAVTTSGYRSWELLLALEAAGYRPSRTSDHLQGLAVDIDAGDADDNLRAAQYLRENMHRVTRQPSQVLFEEYRPHVHLSFPPAGQSTPTRYTLKTSAGTYTTLPA